MHAHPKLKMQNRRQMGDKLMRFDGGGRTGNEEYRDDMHAIGTCAALL
jgi:hypothetical protein